MTAGTLSLGLVVDAGDVADARRAVATFFYERGMEPEIWQRGNRIKVTVLIERGFTERDGRELGLAFREAFGGGLGMTPEDRARYIVTAAYLGGTPAAERSKLVGAIAAVIGEAVAEEREACAVTALCLPIPHGAGGGEQAEHIAAAIRARGD